jgi:IS5 family transposase
VDARMPFACGACGACDHLQSRDGWVPRRVRAAVCYLRIGYRPGDRGAPARVDREDLQWHIAARPSDIARLPEGRTETKVQKTQHRRPSMRAEVEHPFRVVKRQFGLMKVRFRGLTKNTARVVTLFALSNLWMARKQLMAVTGVVRPKTA